MQYTTILSLLSLSLLRLFFYVNVLVSNAELTHFLPTFAMNDLDFCLDFCAYVTKFMEQRRSKVMSCLAVMWEDRLLLLAKQCFNSSTPKNAINAIDVSIFAVCLNFSVSPLFACLCLSSLFVMLVSLEAERTLMLFHS